MAGKVKPRQGEQRALVSRLMAMCGGGYSPEIRRRYFISGPQWAAAYQGQALFHAPTREPISAAEVIRHYAEIGIGYWSTHDTDVIPTEDLMADRQAEILDGLKKELRENGLRCSMVTCETFFHPVWSASPAAEAPEVRAYAAARLKNTVALGHELGAQFAVYWPGTLGYLVQGAVEETEALRWYAEGINAACEADIALARRKKRKPLRHCLEAKPFEPQAQILLPTTDAMLAFIDSGLLKHPEMVGVNPEYLHELMWGGAPRAVLARALLKGKLWHFDINDGYPLKHDVDIGVGLVNPLDWLNVLVLLRSHGYTGPFNLDYKPPRTTSNDGVFRVSFPTAVDRFMTLWEIAGEALEDRVIQSATGALKAGGRVSSNDPREIFETNRELLTLHELIGHRLFEILLDLHRGRKFSGAGAGFTARSGVKSPGRSPALPRMAKRRAGKGKSQAGTLAR
jgi:xylose isomerase